MAKAAFNSKNTFDQHAALKLRLTLVKCYICSEKLCGAETWTQITDSRKVLKCGAREEWRRSVGLIMRETGKYYIQSRREIFCIQ